MPSLHYGPDTTIVFDGYEEGQPLKTTLIKEGDAMCTMLSASLLRHEGRVIVKIHQQAETGPNDKRSTERKRLHCGERTRGCRCGHSKDGSGDISSTHYDAHWR